MGRSFAWTTTAAGGAIALLLSACGQAQIPDVVGEDLAFTRGALASADLDYDIDEVEVTKRDQDGVVQDAYYDDDGETVVVELGTLPSITVTGEFTLVGDAQFGDRYSKGDTCSGSGGYSDFGSGMNVVVKDGSGITIGTTRTGQATYIDMGTGRALYCQTEFELELDIVDFYEIEVGRRGGMSYSYDELRALDFHLGLSLG